MTSEKSLDSLVCVVLDVHLWSGRRKLTTEDLIRVADADLPPQDLASLGSKKICDPGELAAFSRLKRRAERCLFEAGYRFLGGYGIPESRLASVRSELDQIKQSFETEKQQFLADYDDGIERWVTSHPEWETIIRKAAVPVDVVRKRLSFAFRIFKVALPDSDPDGDELMEGAYDAILSEVATQASRAWDQSFQGKEVVSQKALWPVTRMRDKLNGLSFVDNRIAPIVREIDSVLASVPDGGKFGGDALRGVRSLVLLLLDTDRMVAFGEAALANPSDADVDDESVGNLDNVIVDNDTESAPEPPSAVPVRKRVVSPSGLFF